MAPLRSPFFPPNTVTTASLSFRSVSSLRTIYILPMVRHGDFSCFPYNAFFLGTALYRYKPLNFFDGILLNGVSFLSVPRTRLDIFLERLNSAWLTPVLCARTDQFDPYSIRIFHVS